MVSLSILQTFTLYGCIAAVILGFYDNYIDSSSTSNLRYFSSQLQQIFDVGITNTPRKLSTCPNPETFPTPPTPLTGCTQFLTKETFTGHGKEWKTTSYLAKKGVKEEILFHDSKSLINSQYLKISHRPTRWNGPSLQFKKFMKECIQPDVPYLFRVDVRLEMADITAVSQCSQNEVKLCPRLQWEYKNSRSKRKNMLNLSRLSDKDIVKDGKWVTWTDVITFSSEYLEGSDEGYGALTINGPEPDVEISIDNFEITLPPKEYYPDPEAVCDELIVNGDSSVSPFYSFPIISHDPRENLYIASDASGNYMTMNNRKHYYSGPILELTPGCLRDGAAYKFTSKVRIQSDTPTESQFIIKYKNESGEDQFETVANCQKSSKQLDWQECDGRVTFSREKFSTPPIILSFVTLQGSTDIAEWRDLSLKPDTCSSEDNIAILQAKECMRNITVHIDPQADPETMLYIGSTTHDSVRAFTSEVKKYSSPDKNTNVAIASRSYKFQLPGGDYIGSFILGDDTKAWPTFAYVTLGESPTCSNSVNSIIIDKPPHSVDACKNLALLGDLESKHAVVNARWFHNGASMKIVNDETKKYLSTVQRTSPGHGLYHFLDTRCMILGETYSIHAKFKITSDESEPVCVPNSRAQGEGCPRVNIHAFKHGNPVTKHDNIAAAVVPFNPGGWNEIYGSFRIDQSLASADKVIFFIDGVKEGVQIVLDDVRIIPKQFDVQMYSLRSDVDVNTDIDLNSEEDENCIRNADFELGNSRNWECVGNSCALQMIDGGAPKDDGFSKFAISSGPRENRRYGIAQEIDMGCFSLPGIYEVNANLKLIDSETKEEVICDPYLHYHGLPDYCPTILIQSNDPLLSSIKIVAGLTIGPYLENEWNKMYGIVDITQDMMTWNKMYAYIGMNAENIEIVIDDISLTPANRKTPGITTCRQLVKNGDAEIADARFWSIKAGNNEHGNIVIVDDSGASSSGEKAFYHTGKRTKIYHGMWQELSKSCMLHGTIWKVSAYFKLLDSDGNLIDCDKSNPVGAPNSCPVFRMEACNQRSCTEKISKNLINQNMVPWEMNEWNRYEHTFVMDSEFDLREKFYIIVYGVLPNYRYMVDDISVIKG